MIYSYLFEAKSIQQYLFRTGRLKDTIAASERLDQLVDETETSVLYQVLQSAGLDSDLLAPVTPQVTPTATEQETGKAGSFIRFTRCKGAAFYGICHQAEPLQALRGLWTLTVQQMFPGLDFTDALAAGDSVPQAINQGRKILRANRQVPSLQFPIGSAIMARTHRTGLPSVVQFSPDPFEANWDNDTDFHRQGYRFLDLATNSNLQRKFTPAALSAGADNAGDKQKRVIFPTNLDEDFWFSDKVQANKNNPRASKDIAIIHIDGNRLGALLQRLETALASLNLNDDQYCQVFRGFSTAVSNATQQAAQTVTEWLYQQAQYQCEQSVYTPMRPLVLGGDDITLLCHANFAMQLSEKFCLAFRDASEQQLAPIHQQYLSQSGIKSALTASGGILYHKSGHAFTHSHRLVEQLTIEAKKLTKQSKEKPGPAALAFFRLSSTSTSDYADLKARFQQFSVVEKSGGSKTITLGLGKYLVADSGEGFPYLAQLYQCLEQAKKFPMSIGKWRQMTSHVALGSKIEADRIFNRALDRDKNQQLNRVFSALAPPNSKGWCWQIGEGQWQSVISDLLIIEHFLPENFSKLTISPTKKKEASA